MTSFFDREKLRDMWKNEDAKLLHLHDDHAAVLQLCGHCFNMGAVPMVNVLNLQGKATKAKAFARTLTTYERGMDDHYFLQKPLYRCAPNPVRSRLRALFLRLSFQ